MYGCVYLSLVRKIWREETVPQKLAGRGTVCDAVQGEGQSKRQVKISLHLPAKSCVQTVVCRAATEVSAGLRWLAAGEPGRVHESEGVP